MPARPRITFVVDRPRRAQARTARAISRYLAEDFECRVVFESDEPDLRAWPSDLIHIGSWDSTWHRQFGFEPHQLVRSVTNHRWEEAGLSAEAFAASWLAEAGTVTVCSDRLREALRPHCRVAMTPHGFDPFVFPVHGDSRGPLRFGWVGDVDDPTKGLEQILYPAFESRDALRVAGGARHLAEMGEFYRSIDVITVASEHDGSPLTLIEALASGCFPICTDVGVVRELITHGENGLVVDRDPAAFRRAIAWCHDHVESVRRIGRRNAELMRRRRTWEHVADKWRETLWSALDSSAVRQCQPTEPRTPKPAVEALDMGPRRTIVAADSTVRRVALLSNHYDTRSLDDLIEELATQRLLGDVEFERGPLGRAPNDAELERLRACDLVVTCGGDLRHATAEGALQPEVLDRVALPVLPLGVYCGHGPWPDAGDALRAHCTHVAARDAASAEFVATLGVTATVTGAAPLFWNPDPGLPSDGGAPVVVMHGNRLTNTLDELCEALDPILLVSDVEDFRVASHLVRRHRVRTIVRGDYLQRHLSAASRVLSLRLPHGLLAFALGTDVVFVGGDPAVDHATRLLGLTAVDEASVARAMNASDPQSSAAHGAAEHLHDAMQRVLASAGLATPAVAT